ncbi:MAG: bi-domain-containing oxidoreductase [Chloroflexota bacterium]|nr:bi-domain-containing oxidoreductase [Chloroflexota bacterium]
MKQVLQNIKTGETIVAEVPQPQARPGQALVRNAASLVSAGTERMVVEFAGKSLVGKARARPDLVKQVLEKARREGLITTAEAAFNRLDQPMSLGYSSAGTIVRLGEDFSGLRVGQRVACAGGGFAVHAEYISVPRILLTPLPDDVEFESAAFSTLGAISLHGFRLAEVQLGERVAVIGLGLLGLLAAIIADAAGCQVLGIDLDSERVSLATKMGIQAVMRDQAKEAVQGFSHGIGCDAVLICADTPAADPVELAGDIARDRARVIAVGAVGLNLPRKVYYEKELTFLNSRSYGPGRYDPAYEEGGQDYPIGYVRWTEARNLQAFVDLLASKRLDVTPLITHRYPIERATQAYKLITSKDEQPFLGVLLTYPETAAGEGEKGERMREVAEVVPVIKEHASHVSKQAETDVVRLGMLGAGNFATGVMLPAIRKVSDIELIGIASASGASAQHAADRFDFAYACSDEARILDDPQINTVAILTRHNHHARQVIATLRTGKHVFCEKPLALNDGELNAILDVMVMQRDKRKGIGEDANNSHLTPLPYPLLTVGFNRRFAPLAIRMKAFLLDRSEPLVAHYRINAGYLPLTHWTQDPDQGGGRIIGEGCHFIDFLTFLVGSPPVAVTAHGLPDDGHYQEDNVVITLSYPDGSLGTVSYLANGDKTFPKERVEVFCGGRVAVLDDFRSLETVSNGKRQTYRARLRQDKGHHGEWLAFRDAILNGGPAPIPYDQIVGVTRGTFAAVQSVRSGDTVKLPGQHLRKSS